MEVRPSADPGSQLERHTSLQRRRLAARIFPVTKANTRSPYGLARSAARKRPEPAGTKTKPASVRLFSSPEAQRVKEEMCAVGRKLWLRQMVDGNGGNISYRIGPNQVICTPTMISKYDLTPADLCMVDLEGNQIAGTRKVTSEILLHLEIFKQVPEAKAAVHCHPPHATAYAITGHAPDGLLLPEYEIFVGQVAIAPYETPGTPAFARTVLPFVKNHNAVLLRNHGVICWADNVTMAEWHCEILESYCAVLTLARQLGQPLTHIPGPKGEDLRARRKSMGFPDVLNGNGRVNRKSGSKSGSGQVTLTEAQLDSLAERITRRVLREITHK
jgi:L-fuculose-phosphate aldolase